MRCAAFLLLAGFILAGGLLGPTPLTAAAGTPVPYMTSLDWPVALAFPPDGRVFFAERLTGNIRIIDGGILLGTPFFTLVDTVGSSSSEQGLLGLAIDPQFPASPYVYAYHTFRNTTDGTTYNRVVRVSATGNSGAFDRVVLDRIPTAAYHNGGIIGFGPDGTLYITDGDASSPASAQDPLTLSGKILRANPDGTIPSDNPFVGNGSANPYVFTYGHRNVFGLAFHPITDRVFITENGPNCNDEINLLEGGRNYGWGSNANCFDPLPPPQETNQDGPNPVLPTFWWQIVVAPTNVAVYTGPMFPALQGDLIVGDVRTPGLHHLDLAAPNYDTIVADNPLVPMSDIILDVETGPDGAIWFTTTTAIYRYVDTAQAPTAAFTMAPARPSPGAFVTFDGSTSSDPDGTITAYDWDFGDGNIGSGPIVSHAYGAPGTYPVTLRIVDNETFSDTETQSITVNAPPVAMFSATPIPSHIGEAVQFDATPSFDPDGTIVTYAWLFGDGAIASGVIVSHAYVAKGAFTASLTVTDADGVTAMESRVIPITNRAPVITAADPTTGVVELGIGLNETFAVTAEDPDLDVLTYTWRVNGIVVPGTGPSLEFASGAAGTYVINVTVSDGQAETSHEWIVHIPSTGDRLIWVYVLISLAAGFGVILALFLWRRKRRRTKGSA